MPAPEEGDVAFTGSRRCEGGDTEPGAALPGKRPATAPAGRLEKDVHVTDHLNDWTLAELPRINTSVLEGLLPCEELVDA